MRFGAPVFGEINSPEDWIKAVKSKGYTAAYCPLNEITNETPAYKQAAEENDIVIAEVGAWGNNPIHPDPVKRKEARDNIKKKLALADTIGARCCVNVPGTRHKDGWAGSHEKNFADETFDMVVESVQEFIDDVNPQNTYYTLETMPWIEPDSAETYLKLKKAIDRKQFAVHFDPVNIVSSTRTYFNTAALLRNAIKKLGPFLRSLHAKDMKLEEGMPVVIKEIIPGEGNLDYQTFILELDGLADKDMPLMIEHLKTEEEYDRAAAFIRGEAEKVGVSI